MRVLTVCLGLLALACGSADKPADAKGTQPASQASSPAPKASAPVDSEALAKAFFAASATEAARMVDWTEAARAKALTDVAEGIVAGEQEDDVEEGEQPFALRLPLTVIRKVGVASLAKDDRAVFVAGWKPPGECTLSRGKAPVLPELPADILAELPPPYAESYARTRRADEFVANCTEHLLDVSIVDGKIVNFSRTIEMDVEASRFQGYAPPPGEP